LVFPFQENIEENMDNAEPGSRCNQARPPADPPLQSQSLSYFVQRPG
jgi:hypothetical protein